MRLLSLAASTQMSEVLGWTLIHSLWEGLIIAAALAALLLWVRSPRIRYAAGFVALLAMLASFALTMTHFLPESGAGGGTLIKLALPPWSPLADVSTAGNYFPEFRALIPWVAPLWIVGVCMFYLRYAVGWLSLYRVQRGAACHAPDTWQRSIKRLAIALKVSRPVVLLESLRTDTPVVLGHFRPVVLVPLGFLTGLPVDHVEAILLHELAHVSRSDYFVNVCQRLIEGLFFYHPAVWWISRVIRDERENCCDDMVVDLRGDPPSYAMALTALEHNRHGQAWFTPGSDVAATGGKLMKRNKRLLYPKGPSGIWAPAFTAVVLMMTTAMLLAAWRLNPLMASGQMDKKVNAAWQKWLNEDVVYIISDEEKAAFEQLKTDDERQHFVEEFWARRDPIPGTPENEFKQEHYRRIAYANSHWGGNLPGWKTDRGHIYIRYGPPDEIDSHPSGGSYNRPESEGGGTAMTYPFEDWRYNRFEGIGSLSIEFLKLSSRGEFRMALDPNQKYKKP